MAERDLSLSARSESTRESLPVALPVHFSLNEIKAHFDENMASIQKQYDIADALIEEGKNEEAKTIWRSQVVLFEGVLDFYLHEINKYAIYQIYLDRWSETKAYEGITVPIKTVKSALDSSGETDEWFFAFVNQKYSHSVFMGAKPIKDLLNLTGIEYRTVMRKVFQELSERKAAKAGDEILNQQYDRRNEIAHQLDRSHASATQNDIDKDYVEQYAENICKFVEAIHITVQEKDSSIEQAAT